MPQSSAPRWSPKSKKPPLQILLPPRSMPLPTLSPIASAPSNPPPAPASPAAPRSPHDLLQLARIEFRCHPEDIRQGCPKDLNVRLCTYELFAAPSRHAMAVFLRLVIPSE